MIKYIIAVAIIAIVAYSGWVYYGKDVSEVTTVIQEE
jgi:predicted negative regulator of RcsB-dependent stress response|tara:strand:+ start:1173 stop:1283 length:111 start_codon:yes stop_codon:yes gene_type:complete